MSLRSINIQNVRTGVGLGLPLRSSDSGYFVKGVDGLDPVKAELVYSSFGLIDGVQFQSARRESRNIVVSLGFDPDYASTSVSDLRRAFYSVMNPKDEVVFTIVFADFSGALSTYRINGYIETIESPVFSKDPELTISIICPDPDFLSSMGTVRSYSTVTSSGTSSPAITYEGTAPTGYAVTMNINRAVTRFDVLHITADGLTNTLTTNYSFASGDKLEISTVPRAKGIWVTRAGVKSTILQSTTPESAWSRFTSGVNYFKIVASGTAIPYTLNYQPRISGI